MHCMYIYMHSTYKCTNKHTHVYVPIFTQTYTHLNVNKMYTFKYTYFLSICTHVCAFIDTYTRHKQIHHKHKHLFLYQLIAMNHLDRTKKNIYIKRFSCTVADFNKAYIHTVLILHI